MKVIGSRIEEGIAPVDRRKLSRELGMASKQSIGENYTVEMRKCLGCSHQFTSINGLRICHECKSRPAWKWGAL